MSDLISREALKKALDEQMNFEENCRDSVFDIIDNAPTLGEYVDISKLRLMTVEECAGHTIEYAMGWKACIEWIKKGGAE